MTGKNVNFGDKIIKKSDFYKNKKVTKIADIDVNKILISKEQPYGTKYSFKYFIGYNDNDFIRPLCIKLPQMSGYVRKVEGSTTMSFTNNDSKLSKSTIKYGKKIEKFLTVEFDSKPVYDENDKYIKTKIKICDGNVNTNFQGNDARFCCKAKKKYYPQTLSKEWKFELKG